MGASSQGLPLGPIRQAIQCDMDNILCRIELLETFLSNLRAMFVPLLPSWTPLSVDIDDVALQIKCKWFPSPTFAPHSVFPNLSEWLLRKLKREKKIFPDDEGFITGLAMELSDRELKRLSQHCITEYFFSEEAKAQIEINWGVHQNVARSVQGPIKAVRRPSCWW